MSVTAIIRMMVWQTLSEIKLAEVARISAGLVVLKKELLLYAKAHTGSFLIFGSAARGDYRYNSDVDILVDFSGDEESDAWHFAEDCCHRLGLKPDVRPKSLCEQRFVDHVAKGALEIRFE